MTVKVGDKVKVLLQTVSFTDWREYTVESVLRHGVVIVTDDSGRNVALPASEYNLMRSAIVMYGHEGRFFEASQAVPEDTHRITFDVEDGKPVCESVKMEEL